VLETLFNHELFQARWLIVNPDDDKEVTLISIKSFILALADVHNKLLLDFHKPSSDEQRNNTDRHSKEFYRMNDSDLMTFSYEEYQNDLRRHSRYTGVGSDGPSGAEIQIDIEYLATKYTDILLENKPLIEVKPLFTNTNGLGASNYIRNRLGLNELEKRNLMEYDKRWQEVKELFNKYNTSQKFQEIFMQKLDYIAQEEIIYQHELPIIDIFEEEEQSLFSDELLKSIKVRDLELVRRRIQLEKFKDRLEEWNRSNLLPNTEIPLKDEIMKQVSAKSNRAKIIELLKIQFVDIYTPETPPDRLRAQLNDLVDYQELETLFGSLDQSQVTNILFSHVPALIQSLEAQKD
jgi:hypothetical protein